MTATLLHAPATWGTLTETTESFRRVTIEVVPNALVSARAYHVWMTIETFDGLHWRHVSADQFRSWTHALAFLDMLMVVWKAYGTTATIHVRRSL